MNHAALETSRQVIAHHSKSFSLASKLLPGAVRDRAVVVYAWCRRADDAVDMEGASRGASALAQLRGELDAIYDGRSLDDPVLNAFADVVESCRIPKHYPHELLEGLAMDVRQTDYDGMPRLLHYSYRVAGTVGLMMCHVMGVRDDDALLHAAHLGAAMQLTNICRDVAEDWQRERLYLPRDLLARHDGACVVEQLGGPLPHEARQPLAAATAELLDIADGYYASGDIGIPALSWRCALAIRTARHVYAAIGERVRAQGCDPLAGRAWVSGPGKLRLAALACTLTLWNAVRRGPDRDGRQPATPSRLMRFEDVFAVELSRAPAHPAAATLPVHT